MFHNVNGIVLLVRDFDRCLKFYRDALELQVVHSESKFAVFKMKEQVFALREISAGAEIINVDVKAFESQTRGVGRVLLCAQVDNVDEVYEKFKANGVEFSKAPTDEPWGIRAAYFHDPEDNIWEILRDLDLTPQQKGQA